MDSESNHFGRTVEAIKLLEHFRGLRAVLALVAGEIFNEHGAFGLKHGVAIGLGGSASVGVAKGFVDVVARRDRSECQGGEKKVPH